MSQTETVKSISSNPTALPTGVTSNPTVDPTTDPSSNPTMEPTYHPSIEPTYLSSAPTFDPTISAVTVYPVTVMIEIEYEMEDIPLDLIARIVEQTLNYVLNASDLIGRCELTEDELRFNKTESGIQFVGDILACLDESQQLVLVTQLVSELTTEIVDNINDETRLAITDYDVTLKVDGINPFASQQTTADTSYDETDETPSNDTTQIAHLFTVSNISIAVATLLVVLVLLIYLCRRYKSKKMDAMEANIGDNLQIEPGAADGSDDINDDGEVIVEELPELPELRAPETEDAEPETVQNNDALQAVNTADGCV
eukprot:219323_1